MLGAAVRLAPNFFLEHGFFGTRIEIWNADDADDADFEN